MNDSDFDEAVAEAVKLATADQKLAALERLRKNVLKERRLLRALTVLSIVLACGAIWLGLTVRQSVQENEASRAAARAGSCQQDNIRIAQHNDLVDAVEAERQASLSIQSEFDQVIDTSIASADPTDPQIKAFRLLIERLRNDVNEAHSNAKDSIAGTKVPLRDCSPEGIATYLEKKP